MGHMHRDVSVLSLQPTHSRLAGISSPRNQDLSLYLKDIEPHPRDGWEVGASQFLDHLMDPSALGAMLGASWTYRTARFFLVAKGVPKAAASTLAFGAEAAGFPLFGRAIDQGLGRPTDWSATALERDVKSSFLVLGGLKLFGAASQSSVEWWRRSRLLRGTLGDRAMETSLPLAGMYLGILSGHWGEQGLGLRPVDPQENLALHSLATLIHFVGAGRALGPMATGQMRSLEFSLNRPRPGGERTWLFPQPLLASAGVSQAPKGRRPMPSWVLMSENGDGKGSGERKTSSTPSSFAEARITVILRDIEDHFEAGRAGTLEPEKLLSLNQDVSFLETMAPTHPKALQALGKLMSMNNIVAGAAIRRLGKNHSEPLVLLEGLAVGKVPGALTSLEMVAHENLKALEVLKRLAIAKRPGALESFHSVARNYEEGLRAIEEMYWDHGEEASYSLLVKLGQEGGMRSHRILTNLLTRTLAGDPAVVDAIETIAEKNHDAIDYLLVLSQPDVRNSGAISEAEGGGKAKWNMETADEVFYAAYESLARLASHKSEALEGLEDQALRYQDPEAMEALSKAAAVNFRAVYTLKRIYRLLPKDDRWKAKDALRHLEVEKMSHWQNEQSPFRDLLLKELVNAGNASALNLIVGEIAHHPMAMQTFHEILQSRNPEVVNLLQHLDITPLKEAGYSNGDVYVCLLDLAKLGNGYAHHYLKDWE